MALVPNVWQSCLPVLKQTWSSTERSFVIDLKCCGFYISEAFVAAFDTKMDVADDYDFDTDFK